VKLAEVIQLNTSKVVDSSVRIEMCLDHVKKFRRKWGEFKGDAADKYIQKLARSGAWEQALEQSALSSIKSEEEQDNELTEEEAELLRSKMIKGIQQDYGADYNKGVFRIGAAVVCAHSVAAPPPLQQPVTRLGKVMASMRKRLRILPRNQLLTPISRLQQMDVSNDSAADLQPSNFLLPPDEQSLASYGKPKNMSRHPFGDGKQAEDGTYPNRHVLTAVNNLTHVTMGGGVGDLPHIKDVSDPEGDELELCTELQCAAQDVLKHAHIQWCDAEDVVPEVKVQPIVQAERQIIACALGADVTVYDCRGGPTLNVVINGVLWSGKLDLADIQRYRTRNGNAMMMPTAAVEVKANSIVPKHLGQGAIQVLGVMGQCLKGRQVALSEIAKAPVRHCCSAVANGVRAVGLTYLGVDTEAERVGHEFRHLFSLDTDERGAVFLFRKQLMVSKILRDFYDGPPQMGSLDDTGRNDGGDGTSTSESSDTPPPPPPPPPSTRRTQVTKPSSAGQSESTRKAESSSKGGTKSTSGTRPSGASTGPMALDGTICAMGDPVVFRAPLAMVTVHTLNSRILNWHGGVSQ